MKQRFAFLFPGQGSQHLGMLDRLSSIAPKLVKDLVAEANEACGMDLGRIINVGPSDALNATSITQPALLLTSIAYWKVYESNFLARKPSFFLGHSLGEYSALTASGCLQFADAIKLTSLRGNLMEKTQSFVDEMAMAALLPSSSGELDALRQKIGELESIDVAAINSPNQIMISGLMTDIKKACDELKRLKLVRVSKILDNVHIAFHSRLMQNAKMEFAAEIEKINFLPLNKNCHFISNNTGRIATHDHVQQLLVNQFTEPVLWQASIETCLREDGMIRFVELGPGKVLTNMLRKDFKIDNIIDIAEATL